MADESSEAADEPSSDGGATAKPVRVAFVCVRNAGRSQMAHALAGQELARRDATDRIELLTGGTDSAENVHEVVVGVMAEEGIDLSDRTPREITPGELETCDVVVTMGCSAEDVCPATWRGDSRDWDLGDPHGKDLETVRAIRDQIAARVRGLFDELEVGVRV